MICEVVHDDDDDDEEEMAVQKAHRHTGADLRHRRYIQVKTVKMMIFPR